MTNFKNISRKWRKITAVLLLVNFFVSPMLFAFPQEECSGTCEMVMPHHNCESDQMQSEATCCDMMEMNSDKNVNATPHCGMEISDIDCALVYHEQISTVYLIPKTIDSKIEFVQIAIINFEENGSESQLFDLIQDFSQIKTPPIYLTNSVFLI